MDDEPDYEAIWRWIVASAEQQAEEQRRWQARWFEGRATFDADIAYAAQRTAGRAWVRHVLQQLDLATAINDGDLTGYLQRWYPTETPNGSSISFIHSDEAELVPPEGWHPGRQYSGESTTARGTWTPSDKYVATFWESEDCIAARR